GYMRDKPASGRTPTTRGFLLIILVVGLAGIVVVGGYLLVVLRRYNDTDADLVIAPSGMTDRWLVDQPVPWAEIRRVRFVPGYAIKAVTPVSPHAFMSEPGYVDIEYLDDNAYLERLIGYDRRRVKKYRDRTGRTASVPLSGDGGLGFALPASDIAWLMARYCKVEGLPPGYRPQHPVLAAVSA
ncbi:MAG: hypothetical protein VW475_14160, partial [Curvibacter sp.]